MKIHYFQHVPFEGLGNIEDWIQSKGHDLSATRFYEEDALPELDHIDWLIVMGGPMGVNDEHLYKWLAGEKKFIRQAIDRGIRVLGICLGAQLIASVLGARVYPNAQKEIGWHPVELTPEGTVCPMFAGLPNELMTLHWHGDTFDLPDGASHLAQSKACRYQAFAYGRRVLALQFHWDLKKENVEMLIRQCGHELVDAPYIQSAEYMLAQENYFKTLPEYMSKVLNALEQVR